jgi:thioredoxin-like negative regulator of GroEL
MRVTLICALLVLYAPFNCYAQEDEEATAIAEELAFGAEVIDLTEQNFEHLTQAATGATSGDWLVLFCKEAVARCHKVQQNWQRVSTTLAASREAKGLPRINVAQVDTSQASWLRKRFGIQSVPVVLLFKGGVMYSFHGGGARSASFFLSIFVSYTSRPVLLSPRRLLRRAARPIRRARL